jgi:dTMP kinase
MSFITFEGPEGAGKSTQIALLAHWLREDGRQVVETREPGGTDLGDRLRAILLDSDEQLSPEVEAYLMTAARAEHVRRVIRPALAMGQVVLCDRFVDSTLAYQGGGRGLSEDSLRALQKLAVGSLTPDITILLDLPVEVGLSRRARNGDENRFDREAVAFHERVATWYRAAARANPERWNIIDATLPVAVVHTHVVSVVRSVAQPMRMSG